MSTQPEALRLAAALEQGKFLLSVERDATAAELRRLHAEIEEWRTKSAAWLASPEAAQRLEGYRELGRLAERAETEREALRADAERYRWLRARDHWPACFDLVRGPELDAAIDAAREPK